MVKNMRSKSRTRRSTRGGLRSKSRTRRSTRRGLRSKSRTRRSTRKVLRSKSRTRNGLRSKSRTRRSTRNGLRSKSRTRRSTRTGLRSKSRTRRYLNKVGGGDESSTRDPRAFEIIRGIFFNEHGGSMINILKDDELEGLGDRDNLRHDDNPEKLVVLTLKNKYSIEKQDFIKIVEENEWDKDTAAQLAPPQEVIKKIVNAYDDCSDGMCSIM